jgi:ketosteroid isomerase-like protein
MPTPPEQEAREAYARFVAARDEVDAGRKTWSELADFFTEDAVYIDPAWGRIEGRENIREFFEKSMAGLTGHGWSTPENWIMVDGARVVSQWDQVLGQGADGKRCFVPGLSPGLEPTRDSVTVALGVVLPAGLTWTAKASR